MGNTWGATPPLWAPVRLYAPAPPPARPCAPPRPADGPEGRGTRPWGGGKPREHTLREVIQQLETALFERVTGLTLEDFRLLVSLRLFNDARMNEAVLGFKRYEDASLAYAGIDRHAGETLGGW